MVAENIEPGKGKTHYIEREVEPQREQEGREVEHQFEDSGAVRRGPSETEEKAEGEEGEGRSAEGESVEARVEVPQVLDVDETPEVQANALRLELRVSGRENGHDEVEEDDQVDEEVDCEEEGPQDSLALHRLEGEVAQHPSEESDEGGLEGGELRHIEDDHAGGGESEEDESQESQEVEDVLGHATEDLEETSEHAVESQEVVDLEPLT